MIHDSRIKNKYKTHSTSRTSLKNGGLKQNPSVPTKVGTAPLEKGSSLETLEEKMEKIIKILRKRGWTIGVMESCTGGAVANCITNIPGASDVFGEGKVTYCDEAKIKAGVDKKIIKKWGVYSKETAEEMARKVNPPTASSPDSSANQEDKQIGWAGTGIGVTGNLSYPREVFVALRVG